MPIQDYSIGRRRSADDSQADTSLAGCGLRIVIEHFVQADSSPTQQFRSSGLGLIICNCLVDLISGCIDIRSTLNEGTISGSPLPLRDGLQSIWAAREEAKGKG